MIEKKNSSINWILSKVIDFCNKKGYGSITLIIENGKVVRCKMEESLKPPKE